MLSDGALERFIDKIDDRLEKFDLKFEKLTDRIDEIQLSQAATDTKMKGISAQLDKYIECDENKNDALKDTASHHAELIAIASERFSAIKDQTESHRKECPNQEMVTTVAKLKSQSKTFNAVLVAVAIAFLTGLTGSVSSFTNCANSSRSEAASVVTNTAQNKAISAVKAEQNIQSGVTQNNATKNNKTGDI